MSGRVHSFDCTCRRCRDRRPPARRLAAIIAEALLVVALVTVCALVREGVIRS